MAKILFTIHFATINTYELRPNFNAYELFTIHFATINTYSSYSNFFKVFIFTIHFATINTKELELYYDDTS